MIVLAIMAVAGLVLFWGGRFYAPLIGRVLGEQADRVTPAVAINDGRDYVPTHTLVVFAHHYASIAGAGPIIGPVLAILGSFAALGGYEGPERVEQKIRLRDGRVLKVRVPDWAGIGDVDVEIDGNALQMRCLISELAAHPKFGPWPMVGPLPSS